MFKNLKKVKIILFLLVSGFLIYKLNSLKEVLSSDPIYTDDMILGNNDHSSEKNKTFRKKIGLAILNLGLMKEVTNHAISTNNKIGLGFSIYSDSLTNYIQNSAHNEHEVIISLPSQTIYCDNNDPGPLAIFSEDTEQENAQKISNIISKSNINTSLCLEPDSIFSAEESKVLFLLKQLENNENNFESFIYYDIDSSNFLTKLSQKSFIKNKIIIATDIIDRQLSEKSILASLERMVDSNTANIPFGIIISPTKVTIDVLSTWLSNNHDLIELISISEIIKSQTQPK